MSEVRIIDQDGDQQTVRDVEAVRVDQGTLIIVDTSKREVHWYADGAWREASFHD